MKKSEGFLKFIIIEKFILGIISVLLSLGIISLINHDMEKFANSLVTLFNLDMDNYYIETAIEKIGMLGNGTIIGISIGVISYGTLNLVESYGLHKRKRWAEWLTVITTTLFIPFEIYEIVQALTPVRIGALILNIAIVYYLAKHKELFKGNGVLSRLLQKSKP
ncbi:MAG: hypothetical protein A2073_05605 [Deltaproteobacteria bacterium GWC2_42_11]|nr:MAG: hypothetical protein A2073_05605 [Deltaproteobacteria bacterium GWC2_42_11]